MGVTLSLPWSLSPREEESKPKDKPQKTGECPLPPPPTTQMFREISLGVQQPSGDPSLRKGHCQV